jgi:hypothetical protein
MAVVKMYTELGKYRYKDGYHDCKITYYVYCNKCGSFSVKEYKTARTWAEVALGISLAILGGVALLFMFDLPDWVGIIACFILVFIVFDLFITYAIYANGNEYRCRKCNNTEMSLENVFNYQEEDKSVIDVPDDLTCKIYDYTYA